MHRSFYSLISVFAGTWFLFGGFAPVSQAHAKKSARHLLLQAQEMAQGLLHKEALNLLKEPCPNKKLQRYWDRTRAEINTKLGRIEVEKTIGLVDPTDVKRPDLTSTSAHFKKREENPQLKEALIIYQALYKQVHEQPDQHPFKIKLESALANLYKAKTPVQAALLLSRPYHSADEWWQAISLFRDAKQTLKAEKIERQLLVEKPASGVGRKLAKALGSLGIQTRLGSTEKRMQRIRKLLKTHQNDAAIREAQTLTGGPACEKLYIIGKGQRKSRRYRKAIHTLRKAQVTCPSNGDLWMRSSLLAAQVHTILRNVEEVKQVVAMMEKNQPKHSFIDDALIQLAKAYDRTNRTTKARQIFRKVLKEHPHGDQVNFAAWRIAYTHIRREDFGKAKAWLSRLQGRHLAQAAYWLARGQEEKAKTEAIKAFQNLVTEPPLSFYSWLALHRLEQIAPKEAEISLARLKKQRAEAKVSSSLRSDKDLPPPLIQAKRLYESGLAEDALDDILWWLASKPDEEQLKSAVGVLHAFGAHTEAQKVLRSSLPQLLQRFPDQDSWADWQHAYSLAFRNEVEAAAKKQNIDALLLFALARVESTFDPEIISWAGALGLFQLMPSTGIGAYADVYGKRLKNLDRLLEPGLNAELGAHVLKQGLKRFHGIEALALAAYNGGPQFAQSTLPSKEIQAFDFWVESIGIRETRRYVKKTLQTWGRYRYLYGKTDFALSFPKYIPIRQKRNARPSAHD